ncbi:hypothetical protein [Cribrihabitans pelagius]|uniref:hypothetical protein n=1 Tax=Cribrihabitans pelagius TaxID=1765746 RepID=UPI003B5A9BCA
MRHLLLSLLLAPLPAAAADWQFRPGDQPLSAVELAALPGQSFRFYDGGESRYGAEGAYSYTYSAENGGGTAWGTYRLLPDGSVCVDFTNGFSRCDLYVRNGARMILITEEGERFPVRR